MTASHNPDRLDRAGKATILSLLVPGFGQFYAGRPFWGIFWLIVTPGFWVGSAGTLGWVFHILSALQARRQALYG